MAYVTGGLIQATDYNSLAGTSSTSLNSIWGPGAGGNFGWGQSAIPTVSAGATVTATQWATLVNVTSAAAAHTGTSITARTAPTAGNVIQVLSNMSTDIQNIINKRGDAVANGTQFTGWTGTNSKTTNTTGAWTITFTNTVTWASAAAARYFFNAGGRIKIDVSKTSTGNQGDAEWNDLANTLCGDIYITAGTFSQNLPGGTYTGTTKIGGTGSPNILSTGTGWYNLTTTNIIVYKQFADTAPYTNNFIQHAIRQDAGATQLIITTTWSNPEGDTITGGTAASGATPGTAPCTIVTYFPPSTTYLTNTWGTPTVAATTA